MTKREFIQRLKRRARRVAAPISDHLASSFWTYFDLLVRWNAKINLTSFSPDRPDEAIDRLLIEPLLVSRQHLANGPLRLLDVGSGGGSPAIPLKLAVPGIDLVMVESKARKSAFLREALRHLEVNGAVETARFEELLTRPDFHESFDAVTIRAVKTEARTLASLQAFVRPGGRILLFRGSGAADVSPWVAPPLRWAGTHALGDSASVVELQKLAIP